MKIVLLFYMCHFSMGLTHRYKTAVFITFIWVRDHSRSLTVAPFDRLCTTSQQSAVVIIALSCTVLETVDFEEYRDH